MDPETNPVTPVVDEPAADQPVTVDALKSMIPQIIADYETVVERRQKAFNLTQSEADQEKLDETKNLGETVKFLRALGENDVKTLDEMHRGNKSYASYKVMNEASGSAGGYLVPIEFETSIIKYMEQFDQVRKLSFTTPMNTNVKKLNSLTGEPTAYIVGEGVGITGSALTLGEPVLTAKKYAAIVDWTSEVEEDAELPLVNLIAERVARAIMLKEQTEFISGVTSGSEGLLAVTGVTNVALVTGTTFASITWDDLANMHAALQEVDLVDADDSTFMMSPSVFNVLRKLKSAGSGEYFVHPAPQDGVVGQAWGHNIVLCNQMPKTSATATGTKFVVLTNFKRHSFIGDRRGITMKISTEGVLGGNSLFERDEAALRVTKRTAFVTALQNGIVTLSTN